MIMGSSTSVQSAAVAEGRNPLSLPELIIMCHSSRIRDDVKGILPAHAIVLTEQIDVCSAHVHAILNNAQRFAVLLDNNSQRSEPFLNILSHLKNLRKTIFASKLDSYYHPRGGCAAICIAYGQWFSTSVELASALNLDFSSLSGSIRNVSPSAELTTPALSKTINPPTSSTPSSSYDACFSRAASCEAGRAITALVSGISKETHTEVMKFPQPWIELTAATTNLDDDIEIIKSSKFIVFVITDETAASKEQMRHITSALALGKKIMPIVCTGTVLTDWVRLVLGGLIYFMVDPLNPNELYQTYTANANTMVRVHDSCPAIDMIRSAKGLVAAAAKPRYSDEEVEAEIVRRFVRSALDSGVSQEEVDTILRLDSVSSDLSSEDELEDEFICPIAMAVLPEQQVLQMADIHYTKTRLSYGDLVDILDDFGLPIYSKQVDAMISYEWGSQSLVLDMHQQFTSTSVWFDVLGSMQGNMNSAMASAVESVACVIVFVTQKYQNSINCKLELNYAVHCGKPLIFVLLEGSDTVIQPWLQLIMGDYDVLPLAEGSDVKHPDGKYVVVDYSQKYVRGVPTVSAIANVVSKYASWRSKCPPRPVRCSSRYVYDISRCLITKTNAAKNASHVLCTRCGVNFNPNEPYDGKCRVHSAYYVGGNIIAGRWVCCSNTDKNGLGCSVATSHLTRPMKWTQGQGGTHTWT